MKIHFTAISENLDIINLKNQELAINVGSRSFYTSEESQLTRIPDQP